MTGLGAVRLLAALVVATGASASSAFSVAAAQAVAEPDGRSLGAAVEEVRRSPFHARAAAPSTVALGVQARPGDPIAAVGRPATLAGAPATDTTASVKLSQVFLASWGAAAVWQPAALYAAAHLVYATDEFPIHPEILFWGVVTASVAIPAAGARLAGAPFAAIPGSLVGLGAGIGAGAVVAGMVDEDETIGLVAPFAASSLAQAGVITLFTWLAAEHGDR